MVDYVRDPTPHKNFGGGSTTWVVWANDCVTCQIFEFLFLFFFCFLHHAPRSHFLTDRNDLYAITRVSGQGFAFWGSRQYPTTFRGSHLQKTSPKWAGIGTSQPNRRSTKNSHRPYIGHRWRYSRQISHRDWIQGPFSKKCKIWSNGVMKGSRDLLLKFWDPLHISETVEAWNFKFGMHIDHQGH